MTGRLHEGFDSGYMRRKTRVIGRSNSDTFREKPQNVFHNRSGDLTALIASGDTLMIHTFISRQQSIIMFTTSLISNNHVRSESIC